MTKFQEPQFPAIFVDNQANLRQFDRDLIMVLGTLTKNLSDILDVGISIDDNLDQSSVSVVSHVTPGVEFAVTHGLGKIPTRYVVYGQTAAGSVYDGTTANTKSTFYLKSDVSAVTFRLMFF